MPSEPDRPGGAGGGIVALALSWAMLLAALAWVLLALRLTREDVAGIEHPGMPLALVQLALAVLGALGAGVGASRAGWYLRTGEGGGEALSSLLGAGVMLGAWAVIVLPGW